MPDMRTERQFEIDLADAKVRVYGPCCRFPRIQNGDPIPGMTVARPGFFARHQAKRKPVSGTHYQNTPPAERFPVGR